MTALAEKTGLSRETLYRTLSDKGNPRLDTLATILAAFDLRLSVQPDHTPYARTRLSDYPVRRLMWWCKPLKAVVPIGQRSQ